MNQQADRVDLQPADESSGSDFLAVLLRRKWIIVLFACIGTGLGQLYFSNAKPMFQSRAQISLRNRDTNVMHFSDMLNNAAMLQPSILSTELVTLSSKVLLERAAAKHNLGKFNTLNTDNPAEAAGRIAGGIAISKGGPTLNTEDASVLNISYKCGDQLEASKILDAILDSYKDLLSERSSKSSQGTLQLLTQAVQNTNEKIETAKREYSDFRKKNPLIYSDRSGTRNPHAQRLVDIDMSRSREQLRLIAIKAEMQTIEEALKDGTPAVVNALVTMLQRGGVRGPDNRDPQGNFVDQSLVQLMIEEQTVAQTFGPDHPKVKNLRKTIELIQQLRAANGAQEVTSPQHYLSQYLDSLRQEQRKITETDRVLAFEFERERELAKELLNHEHADADWRDRIERLKKMFDDLTAQLDKLRVTDDPGGVTMELLSPPTLGAQIEPSYTRSLAVGGVLGAVLGLGLAYVIDLADKSFRTPDEIRGQLRIPVIGHIPVIDALALRRERKKLGEQPSKVDETIACHHRPRSNVSEAYRSIRTAIYFGTRGEEHKVIQVTSADAGDGKTTLAANLAVSFAQSGRRVLLLDADFRRARVHSLFGLDNSVGMSSVMAGQSEMPDAILPTEIDNLWVLPSGPRPSNPAELLTSHRFKELLDVLRGKFDTILIDTPPLLAVTDPCAVAPRVDSVLLVLRITKQARPNAQRAKEVLDGLGAKVVGIVVNGVEVRRAYGHDTGYRRYSINGYGYRDYEYGEYYYDDDHSQQTKVVPAKPTQNEATG